ncbi:alpha/beta hydrolase, partial [Bacillus pumilus]
VNSTKLSYTNNILTGKWDHYSSKNGTSMFPVFQHQLLTNASSAENKQKEEQEPVSAELNTDVYVKGGESEKEKKEAFYVEEGTNGLSIQWLN